MTNVKIVSSTNRPYKYTDFYSKETEMMVKFEYRIQLAGKIAYFIRRNTNVPDEYLHEDGVYYLDENNIVKYGFLCPTEYSDKFNRLFTETIEKISNQGDEDYFIDHLLTANKKHRAPSEIHFQMRDEFGLYDITDEEHIDSCIEGILEWSVAHFFIRLTSILYDPGYEGPKPVKQFRIIVCGGRHFNDYARMKDEIDNVIAKFNRYVQEIEIVSGHCAGADQLGEQYARERGYPCKVFPADWEKYGRSAGLIRNSEMIQYASEVNVPIVVAFVSPRSKGTKDTVRKAQKKGFKVVVVEYE